MCDMIHKCAGKKVVYVLLLESCPETGKEPRYVGSTSNCEKRTAQHMGIIPGGAKWTESHRPVDVISCRVVKKTDAEMASLETNYSFCILRRSNISR